MGKKPRPRRDFSPTKDVVFSDDDEALKKKKGSKYVKLDPETINLIEKKTDFKFDDVLKDKIHDAIIKYKAGIELVDNKPRISEQKATLDSICSLSKQLKEALEQIDSYSRMRIINESDWVNFKKTIFDLEQIQQATQDALKKVLPDKGGRPKQYSLEFFIQALIEIYKDAAGANATINFYSDDNKFYSPFLTFAETILTEINEPTFSNHALGNVIQSVIKKRNTPS